MRAFITCIVLLALAASASARDFALDESAADPAMPDSASYGAWTGADTSYVETSPSDTSSARMILTESARSRLRKVLAARAEIESGRPVSREPADLLAGEYFAWRISGCGYADPVVDRGDRWTSVPRIGYGGVPDGRPIVIDKATGAVFHEPEGRCPAKEVLDWAERRYRGMCEADSAAQDTARGRAGG